jgi:hypothetical protein
MQLVQARRSSSVAAEACTVVRDLQSLRRPNLRAKPNLGFNCHAKEWGSYDQGDASLALSAQPLDNGCSLRSQSSQYHAEPPVGNTPKPSESVVMEASTCSRKRTTHKTPKHECRYPHVQQPRRMYHYKRRIRPRIMERHRFASGRSRTRARARARAREQRKRGRARGNMA